MFTRVPAARLVNHQRIPAQTGFALSLRLGQRLKVIDLEGGQVADLMAVSATDPEEWLSNGRTFDYNATLLMREGHSLFSNRSRPFLQLVEDTVGRHDFLYTACSQEMFEIQYGFEGKHPNCLENLARALEVSPDRIPVPFNIFMNVAIGGDGRLTVESPLSEAGDYLVLEARADLRVAVSACSASTCNGGTCGPIALEW